MTPDAFATIMDRAYVHMCPWAARDIADTVTRPHVHFLTRTSGGLIAQVVAGECEILAIATDPNAQRKGVASALLAELVSLAIAKGCSQILLEVASRNHAARSFYDARGFARIGTRPAYYTLRDGTKDDALLLSLAIGHVEHDPAPTSHGATTKSG